MKKVLIICVLSLLGAVTANAQAVYKTSSNSESSGNKGLWYFFSSTIDYRKK